MRPESHVVVISGIVDLRRRETRHDGTPRKYSAELRERAVRLARESERGIAPEARDLGLNPETLHGWVRQAEADEGTRSDRLASAERDELVRLRRENRERVRSNEILKAASVFFARQLGQPRTLGPGSSICRELEVSENA